MAHERGHLFLGSNAHSRQGIMCPSWHVDELHRASMGALLFSEEHGRFMRGASSSLVEALDELVKCSQLQLGARRYRAGT